MEDVVKMYGCFLIAHKGRKGRIYSGTIDNHTLRLYYVHTTQKHPCYSTPPVVYVYRQVKNKIRGTWRNDKGCHLVTEVTGANLETVSLHPGGPEVMGSNLETISLHAGIRLRTSDPPQYPAVGILVHRVALLTQSRERKDQRKL